MPLQISQQFLRIKILIHESTGICSTSRPGITNACICHLYSCVFSECPISEEYYPYHGRKWFLTWLSSAQVEYRTLTAEDFCSKEGAVDSVDVPPAVPGGRMECDLHSGVFREPGRPHDVQLGSFQRHCRDVPYRHTMTGTLRLCARKSRINKV